jgi:hypothetical protein
VTAAKVIEEIKQQGLSDQMEVIQSPSSRRAPVNLPPKSWENWPTIWLKPPTPPKSRD